MIGGNGGAFAEGIDRMFRAGRHRRRVAASKPPQPIAGWACEGCGAKRWRPDREAPTCLGCELRLVMRKGGES